MQVSELLHRQIIEEQFIGCFFEKKNRPTKSSTSSYHIDHGGGKIYFAPITQKDTDEEEMTLHYDLSVFWLVSLV